MHEMLSRNPSVSWLELHLDYVVVFYFICFNFSQLFCASYRQVFGYMECPRIKNMPKFIERS
jgi:hypothetical protein